MGTWSLRECDYINNSIPYSPYDKYTLFAPKRSSNEQVPYVRLCVASLMGALVHCCSGFPRGFRIFYNGAQKLETFVLLS